MHLYHIYFYILFAQIYEYSKNYWIFQMCYLTAVPGIPLKLGEIKDHLRFKPLLCGEVSFPKTLSRSTVSSQPPNPPSVVALVAGRRFATEASRDLRSVSSRISENIGETFGLFSEAFFVLSWEGNGVVWFFFWHAASHGFLLDLYTCYMSEYVRIDLNLL